MTTGLRTSQVEVLRLFDRHGSLTAFQLSGITGRPILAERDRLGGLRYEGLLDCADPDRDWLLGYHLTQLGHEALEGEG